MEQGLHHIGHVGFPQGPWSTAEGALCESKTFLSLCEDGKSWVRFGGSIPATKKSGERKKIFCRRSGNRPSPPHLRRTTTQCNGCLYGLIVEERDGKWYLKRFISQVHNHELLKEDRASELRVIPAERSIPKEVLDYGQSLLRFGMRMRDIHVSLQKMKERHQCGHTRMYVTS